MKYVTMPVIGIGIQKFDDALQLILRAVERANSWRVTGECKFTAVEGGYALHVNDQRTGLFDAVSTTIIQAAPSANKLGTGKAMLRLATGDDLVDQEEVDVTSNFSKPVPIGRRLVVGLSRDGLSYKLCGADCPLT